MKISQSTEETQSIAKNLAQKVKNGGVICLYGDLGSGKTIFTKGLAAGLGVDEFSIKSPTYTYIRNYRKNPNHLYHIDLYRLDHEDELLIQEIQEIASNPKNILIIEWADRLKNHLPDKRIDVYLAYKDPTSREIKINY